MVGLMGNRGKTLSALRRHWRRVAVLAAAIAAMAGLAHLLEPSPYHPNRTPKMDNMPPKIAALFEKTKTVCFSRFVIDVPERAEIVWGGADVPYSLYVYPRQGYMIKAEIKAKIDALTSEEHNEEPSMLIGVFDSINSDSKIVVGYKNFTTNGFAQLHSYIRLGETAFVQSIRSFVLAVDDKNAPMGFRDDKTLYKKGIEELLDVARRLRLRDENEIPNEPGVCIESGFISSPLDFSREVVRIGFRFPEYPDVSFSVETWSTVRPNQDDSLEASIKEGREEAQWAGQGKLFARIKTLRKGDRAIGQWEGAESLNRLPSVDIGAESHDFMFKTIGVANDVLRPYAKITFYTAVKDNTRSMVEPSLTDEEAIAMWDKLTSTIRVRPTKESSETE